MSSQAEQGIYRSMVVVAQNEKGSSMMVSFGVFVRVEEESSGGDG